MSKLSPALQQLISAPHARPGLLPAPPHITRLFASIAREAEANNVGLPAWLCASVRLPSPSLFPFLQCIRARGPIEASWTYPSVSALPDGGDHDDEFAREHARAT